MTTIQVGQPAPDFKLQALVGNEIKDVKLSDYRGKWVALFFYPLDFTAVCPTEITAFSDQYEEFEKLNCVVLAASVDSVYSHESWTKHGLGAIRFPLLSDITKETSRTYGVLLDGKGFALRGLFLIDPEGKIRYQVVHDTGIGRSVEETLRVLSALQTGERCPANWKPGEKTLGK